MGRLFWKIFLWFWLTLALLNVAVGWGVKLYLDKTDGVAGQALQTQVSAVALAFEEGERHRAKKLLRTVSRDNHRPIFVISPEGRDVLNRPLPNRLALAFANGHFDNRFVYHATADLSTGERYHIVAPKHASFKGRPGPATLTLALSITLLISTLVCYLLAKYLSAPVRRLSGATRQLAAGNLDVRIGKMKRKDEIASLAQDFDQMAEKLEGLVNSQKKLLQDVSHELRSPLARLQVALALARREKENQSQYFDRLEKDLERLDFLISEVLTLSRIDTVAYPRETVNLSELCSDIVSDCRFEAQQKDCRIQTSISDGIECHGNSELLRRAIENILRNAIKFSPEKGNINFDLVKEKDITAIRVSDEGPGILETEYPTVFDAFTRADAARDHSISGYGLGLSIAKKAVDLHLGTIEMENREKSGLVVSIILPENTP